MPLVAQSLAITHPLPWKGQFYCDMMQKSNEAKLTLYLKDGSVAIRAMRRLFIDQGQS